MKVISVVRNFELYHRLITQNGYYPPDTDFVVFDNTKDNETITKRYNSFLDNYDGINDDWFVFCHEDWELKENLTQRLESLDKNALYSCIGRVFDWKILKYPQNIGRIENCDKNGDNLVEIGIYTDCLSDVGTFDCQCLIVHSSIISQYNFRFDENLSFDLYVEDFCMNARERFNISSKILQFKCKHYSFGQITPRYHTQLKYLQKKYCNSRHIYTTTCGFIIGKASYLFKILFYLQSKGILSFIFQKKITKSGHLLIKILKIPVYRKLLSKKRLLESQVCKIR